MGLAVLTSLIWGFAYVTYQFGLESFSAAQLSAVRFFIACLPILFVPRPKVPWWTLLLIGVVMFAGQFLLLMMSYSLGMPAGLGSVTQQTQAVFTVLLAAVLLGERPSVRQGSGMAIAFAGLALIGVTIGTDLTPAALALALAAALAWAIGNIVVKRIANVSVFGLMVWCSLIAIFPLLAFSWAFDPQPSIVRAVTHASWLSLAVALYLAVPSTLLGYGLWAYLLRRYPAPVVAPFGLLSPATGILSAALLLGETFSALRIAGMGLILLGLAVIVMPATTLSSSRGARSAPEQSRSTDA